MVNFPSPIMHNKQRGFNLIELMIVVTIIAILAAVATPAYNNYVIRGKRAEARAALFDAAAVLERFYSDNNSYAKGQNTFPSSIKTTTTTGKYTLSMTTTSPYQTYTITATPTFTDTDCGNFTLTQAGVRGISASSQQSVVKECWGR